MKKEMFSNYLSFLYNSTYMPIQVFEEGKRLLTLPEWDVFPEMLQQYRESTLAAGNMIDYSSVDNFLYAGMVRSTKEPIEVVVGPVAITPISVDLVKKLAKRYATEAISETQIEEYFQRTPFFSLSQIINILGMINYELNDQVVDTYSYISGMEYKSDAIAERHSHSLIGRKENEQYHDTYYFEQEYYGYVERGDVNGVIDFMKHMPSFTEGNIAFDSIRQAKNIFITSITLTTRRAIAGGMDIETAYELSDAYIQEVERMSDARQINLLNGTAIIDFTRRVADAHIPVGMPKEIFRAIEYISNHVNQNITVQDIAEELGIDRSTLSRKFTKELGFHISAYIMRRKLEEAKSLLNYTDKPISEISAYLCFSSQAYFQNVFKRKYGMTPRQYRERRGEKQAEK